MKLKSNEESLDIALQSECIHKIDKILNCTKSELSKTSALWINYQRMLSIARAFIAADRMGWGHGICMWMLCVLVYPYLQQLDIQTTSNLFFVSSKMYALENENPDIHQKFLTGFHIVRRSNQYWAGLGSDLVI